jgi:hypothetical protein
MKSLVPDLIKMQLRRAWRIRRHEAPILPHGLERGINTGFRIEHGLLYDTKLQDKEIEYSPKEIYAF